MNRNEAFATMYRLDQWLHKFNGEVHMIERYRGTYHVRLFRDDDQWFEGKGKDLTEALDNALTQAIEKQVIKAEGVQ